MKAQLIRDDASPASVQLLLDREATVIVSAALSFAGKFHPDYKALADKIELELIEAHRGRTSAPESS